MDLDNYVLDFVIWIFSNAIIYIGCSSIPVAKFLYKNLSLVFDMRIYISIYIYKWI